MAAREGKEAVSSTDDISVNLTVPNEVKDEQVDDSSVGDTGSRTRDSRNGIHEVGSSSSGNGVVQEVGLPAPVPMTPGKEGDSDWFFDPQESLSYTRNTDEEDNGTADRSVKFTRTPPGEILRCSGRGIARNSTKSINGDGEEEACRRNPVPYAKQLAEYPRAVVPSWYYSPGQSGYGAEQSDADAAEELCQQVNLARFVSEAIGRGLAKAEVETVMEAQLEAKNFEMARLLDRFRYYEAVNHEMSQTNQETVASWRLRQQRKRRQRWVWGSIAVAVSLGTFVLAWSYMQSGRGSSSTSHDQES